MRPGAFAIGLTLLACTVPLPQGPSSPLQIPPEPGGGAGGGSSSSGGDEGGCEAGAEAACPDVFGPADASPDGSPE